MHSINPLFSIVISTTTTITTITITTSPSQPSQSPASGIRLFDYCSTKSCNSLLPAKPNPPLPACSQRSQIHHYHVAPSEAALSEVRATIPPQPACSQRSLIHCYQRSQIHRQQLAPSEARLSEVRVSIPLLTACSLRSQIVRGESEHSTATS